MAFDPQKMFDSIDIDDFGGFEAELKKAPNANVKSPLDKWTLLVACSDMRQRTKYMEALIKAGAALDMQDDYGDTPLFTAARKNNEEAASVLLRAKADPNAKAGGGDTPLVSAVRANSKGVAKALLAAGADATVADGDGKTPLQIAKAKATPDFDLEDMLQSALPKPAETQAVAAAEDDEHDGATRAGSLAKLSPEESVKAAVKTGLCSFTATGPAFVVQKWWKCVTCSTAAGPYGVCETCAKGCAHASHTTEFQGAAQFYCDCGSEAKACGSLEVKRKAEPQATPEALDKYRSALGMALFDGEVSEKEDELLRKMRAELSVSAAQHDAALKEFNLTADKFLRLHVASAVASVGAGAARGFESDPDAMAITSKEALVVGNSKYVQPGATLKNPFNDARAVAGALTELGFNVKVVLDVMDYDSFLIAVTEFAARLKAHESAGEFGCVGLFFFAGHAVEMKGSNYLLHGGFTNDDMAKQGFAAKNVTQGLLENYMSSQFILQTMEQNCNTNVLILDACRNNPFAPPAKLKRAGQSSGNSDGGKASTGAGGGLAAVYPTGSGLIALSAAPGFCAGDGSDENKDNGMFTNSLLKYMRRRDLHIGEVIFQTAKDVYAVSKGKQHPWQHVSLINHVYLGKPAVSAPKGS